MFSDYCEVGDLTNAAKPCPFCGGSNATVIEGSTFRWRLVKCNCCGAQGPEVRIQTLSSWTKAEWEHRAMANAIAEWNKRSNAIDELTRLTKLATDSEREACARVCESMWGAGCDANDVAQAIRERGQI